MPWRLPLSLPMAILLLLSRKKAFSYFLPSQSLTTDLLSWIPFPTSAPIALILTTQNPFLSLHCWHRQLPWTPVLHHGPSCNMSLDAICSYYSYMFDVDIPMEPSLSTFQELLDRFEGAGITVAEFNSYSDKASPQLRCLLCRTFCSHVSPALLLAPAAAVAYIVPMFISLEVWFSGEHKVIWFFQICCNMPNNHSVIFPFPNFLPAQLLWWSQQLPTILTLSKCGAT